VPNRDETITTIERLRPIDNPVSSRKSKVFKYFFMSETIVLPTKKKISRIPESNRIVSSGAWSVDEIGNANVNEYSAMIQRTAIKEWRGFKQ
jgi:hypothetical protein